MTGNQLKTYLQGILGLMLIINSSDAQTIGKIKQASDNHNQSSSSSSSSSGSTSSRSSGSSSSGSDNQSYDSYYESSDDSYNDNYNDNSDDYETGEIVISLLFDIFGNAQRNREERLSQRQRFQEPEEPVIQVPRRTVLDYDFRHSLDSRKVMITNGQVQVASKNYFGSFRYNVLTEPRAKDVDNFPTFEMQFLGFNTNTYPFNFAMATGFYSEIYSSKLYWEHMARVRWEVSKGITFNAEGRYASDDGVVVRTEGTISALATIKEWKKSALHLGAFFTSALYYETVPVENIGLNLRLSFKNNM